MPEIIVLKLARGVKVGRFKGEVNSRWKLEEADLRGERAHIHKPKSAVATKINGRFEYLRYMTWDGQKARHPCLVKKQRMMK